MVTDTKEQILDAAEELFAEHGFDATSLRIITSKAKVNLAAVHYHYGSKDALIEAVLFRRLQELNRERLELLDACEAEAADDVPDLEGVLLAFVGPPLRLASDPDRGGEVFMRLMGFAYSQPRDYVLRVFMERFRGFIRRFTNALCRALPQHSQEEILWRIHFMIGAMAHTMAGSRKLEAMSAGFCDTSDTDAIIERLVTFLSTGMRGERREARERAHG